MNPISEGVAIVGDIAVVLAGAFPLVYVITRVFQDPLMKLGHVLGMNDIAAAGLVATPWPTISPCSRCSTIWTGGVRSSTWPLRCPPPLCSATIWAFTAGFDSTMIFPMIVGKLVGGVTAVAVAM